MANQRKMAALVYYGSLAVLLVLIVTKDLDDLLPEPLARHIAQNSEGILLALALPAWIQYARPRLADGSVGVWLVTCAVATLCLGLGMWLYSRPDVSGRLITLNEPLFALAVLVPYVQLRRPVPRALAVGMPLSVLVLIIVAHSQPLVVDLAEGLAMLVLIPFALDVMDRRPLDPGQPSSWTLRLSWYGCLLIAAVLVALLDGAVEGGLAPALGYAARVQEAVIATVALGLYLSAADRECRNVPAAHSL